MIIGLLGGTFDPIHNGHLYLAKEVLKKLSLDKVIFMPTYIPPHKKGARVTPARHRYNMVKLAIKGNKRFELSDMEMKRKGRSYSIQTLKALRKKIGPKAEIFFITGSDSLKDLNKWKDYREILALSCFVVVKRPGFKIKSSAGGFIILHINAKDVSSTGIRERIKKSRSIEKLVPPEVKKYIKRYKLYL